MKTFVVFDRQTKKPVADRYGHVKVYANEKAARRAAQRFNNRYTYPDAGRFGICAVSLNLEIVWGQPNCHRV